MCSKVLSTSWGWGTISDTAGGWDLHASEARLTARLSTPQAATQAPSSCHKPPAPRSRRGCCWTLNEQDVQRRWEGAPPTGGKTQAQADGMGGAGGTGHTGDERVGGEPMASMTHCGRRAVCGKGWARRGHAVASLPPRGGHVI